MTLVDITRVLHDGFPAWPHDVPYQRQETRFSLGDATCRISALRLSAHAGTHVDAPAHLCADEGTATTVDQLDLELLCGPARVLDLRGRPGVEARDIQALTDCPPRLLLRTDNSDRPYDLERFVALSAAAASSLVSRACLLVGVDGPSVDPAGSELVAHRLLLEAGVIILEGLDLGRAAPGDYELYCLPLALRGSDGAPARAVLRKVPR